MNKLLFLLLLFFILAACRNDSDAPELIRPVTSRIDTAIVEYGDVISVSLLTGVTRMSATGFYFEDPAAAFGEFLVRLGEHVSRGQILLTLDTEPIEEEIERLELEFERIYREHDIARRLNEAYLRINNNEWARLNARQEQERNNLQREHLQVRIDSLIASLEHTSLYAEFDGIVTWQANISTGGFIHPFEPLIFISDPTDIFVDTVNLTLSDFPRMDAPIPPPFPWIPIVVSRAVLIHVYTDDAVIELEYIPLEPIDRAGRSHPDWPVRFEILGDISYGEYVIIYFYFVRELNTLRIPSGAVFQVPGPGQEAYVHRIIDGQMIRTYIEISALTDVFAAVSSGLERGDVVFVRP